MMSEYIAQFLKSGQITEDKWVAMRPTLKIYETTTIGEIVKWAKERQYDTSDFTILELNSLNPTL